MGITPRSTTWPWPSEPPSAAHRASYADADPQPFWLASPARPAPRPALAERAECDLAVLARGAAAGQQTPPAIQVADTGLKVVLVGLDGADWRVIRPLMEKGELPAFAAMMREGASGDLATLHDSNSAVIWASIYTGATPERHGIDDFYRISLPGMTTGLFPVHRTYFKELADLTVPLGLARQVPVDRFSLKVPPIWEIGRNESSPVLPHWNSPAFPLAHRTSPPVTLANSVEAGKNVPRATHAPAVVRPRNLTVPSPPASAGMPTTMWCGSTSRVTTAPVPIMAWSPTVVPASTVA